MLEPSYAPPLLSLPSPRRNRLFSLSGRATLSVGLVFLLSLPVAFFFLGEEGMELPATLSFVFLVLGTMQLGVEALRNKSDETA